MQYLGSGLGKHLIQEMEDKRLEKQLSGSAWELQSAHMLDQKNLMISLQMLIPEQENKLFHTLENMNLVIKSEI